MRKLTPTPEQLAGIIAAIKTGTGCQQYATELISATSYSAGLMVLCKNAINQVIETVSHMHLFDITVSGQALVITLTNDNGEQSIAEITVMFGDD